MATVSFRDPTQSPGAGYSWDPNWNSWKPSTGWDTTPSAAPTSTIGTQDSPNPSYPGDPASDPFTPAPPAAAPAPSSPGTPSGGSYVNSNNPYATANTPLTAGQLDPASVVAGWMAQFNPQGHTDPNYWIQRMHDTGGLNAGNLEYWKGRFMEAPGTHQEGPSGGGYAGTNVFSDPATQQWEQLVNQLVGKLNTPYQPAGFQPMIDYLNKYFQQLQGPAYTPAQMDLIQTQSTDPLMAQRDASRQQITQNFAARGITPDSGIVQQALEQSDQKYGVANTQNQAGFATNAIGLDRQNAATAAQVGQQIPQLQQGLYNYNLGNQLTGLQTAKQVPDEAWRRLTGANSLIDPLNTAGSLATQSGQFGLYGQNQTNAFIQALMQLLSGYFG